MVIRRTGQRTPTWRYDPREFLKQPRLFAGLSAAEKLVNILASWELCHAHDNKDCIGRCLDWRSGRPRHGDCKCSVLLSAAAAIRLRLWRANLERLPAGLHGAGRRLCAVSRSQRRRMAVHQATPSKAVIVHPIQVRSAARRADGMATELERTRAQRYLLGSQFGRLLGGPRAMPEFCRGNFALRM